MIMLLSCQNTNLLNNQLHLYLLLFRLPVIGTAVQEQLLSSDSTEDLTGTQGTKHQPILIRAIAQELGVAVGDISDMELCLADHSPAVSVATQFIFFAWKSNRGMFIMMTRQCRLLPLSKTSHVNLKTVITAKLTVAEQSRVGTWLSVL